MIKDITENTDEEMHRAMYRRRHATLQEPN
jgi:hypothetical protein